MIYIKQHSIPQGFLRVFFVCVLFCFVALQSKANDRRRFVVQWVGDSAAIGKWPAFCDSASAVKICKRTIEKLRITGYWLATLDTLFCKDTAIIAKIYCGSVWNGGIKIDGIEISKHGVEPCVTPMQFVEQKDKILQNYSNNGYPFVELRFDTLIFSADTLLLQTHIDCGPRLRFGAITFGGQPRCDSLFWYRWCKLKPGQLFNQEAVDESCTRIEESGFARCATPPDLQITADSLVELHFTLQKTPSGQFDGLLGIAQNKDTKETELTGNVNLSLRNALHAAEEITLNWQRAQQKRLTLLIGYEQLFIKGTRFGVNAKLNIERTDTLQMTTIKRLSLLYSLQAQTALYVYVSNKASSILSTKTSDSAKIANSSFNSYGVGLQSFNLDYKFNPRTGYDLRFETGSGQKSYQKGDSSGVITQLEAKLDAAFYIPLGTKYFALKLANKTAILQSTRLFNNELYYFGGNKTLRGYLDDQLRASHYTIFTAELRYLFARNSNFYAFFDQSVYKNPIISTKHTFTPYGFGLGINLRNKNNIFSLCYAVGAAWQNAPAITNGKVHFGFITLF